MPPFFLCNKIKLNRDVVDQLMLSLDKRLLAHTRCCTRSVIPPAEYHVQQNHTPNLCLHILQRTVNRTVYSDELLKHLLIYRLFLNGDLASCIIRAQGAHKKHHRLRDLPALIDPRSHRWSTSSEHLVMIASRASVLSPIIVFILSFGDLLDIRLYCGDDCDYHKNNPHEKHHNFFLHKSPFMYAPMILVASSNE